MDANNYNKYLASIKNANDIDDKELAKKVLARIKAEMEAEYGTNDSDVEYLLKKFRYYV